MKLSSLLSVRVCLVLGATLPLFFLTAKPGFSEEVPTFRNHSSVSPKLKQKLQKLAPVESIINPGGNVSFVQESGPSWVQYIQHKGSVRDLRINPSDRPAAGEILQQLQR